VLVGLLPVGWQFGELRSGIVDETFSIFDGLAASGFLEDVILLETFVDAGRDDGLDVCKIGV
jgi:hypothetical protein